MCLAACQLLKLRQKLGHFLSEGDEKWGRWGYRRISHYLWVWFTIWVKVVLKWKRPPPFTLHSFMELRVLLSIWMTDHTVLLSRRHLERLPWWLSGKEPTCQHRRRGFNPWSGKVPHAAGQLSPAPQLLSLRSRAQEPQQKPLQLDAYAPQLQKSLQSNENPVQPKVIKKKKT